MSPTQPAMGSILRKAIAIAISSFLFSSVAEAQGPTSRATLGGASSSPRSGSSNAAEREQIPVPDMFRTEAPLVERNIRFDYQFTNHLQDPPADESEWFTEVSYSFTEQFGINFSLPYLVRDPFGGEIVDGLGNAGAGARYVFIGSEQEARFKLATSFNVFAPTADDDRGLGEDFAVLEPGLLTQFLLSDQAFAQSQLSLGIPTESGETTEFEFNSGIGYVFKDISTSPFFAYPTAIAEVNGFTGVGGAETEGTVIDVTAGLRWSVGKKFFAGFGTSVPVTGPREFETQFIFSLIYRYGVEPGAPVSTGQGAPSSRAYF